jgi:hypothetical protein
MPKQIKTWLLETADGKSIYSDGKGSYSLTETARFKVAAEFVEGQHPGDDKEVWCKTVSDQIGVECHLIAGSSRTEA